MLHELTANEKLILRHLESDSRISFSTIAKKTRKSQQRVSYTVNSLINKGIIKKFYALIDYSKFDIISFRVYFKIRYVNEVSFKEFIDYLVSQTNTLWIATCSGDFDLICTFLASNPSQFNKKLRGIMANFPKQILNYTILTTVVIRSFERQYLASTPHVFKEVIIGGDRVPVNVDGIDMKILSLISDNSRVSSVDIANKLSITPKTVIERIKKLEKKEIIDGYKPLLSLETMGYMSILLLIRYHDITVEIEKRLINYLEMQPNVIGVVKTLGEWDVEVEIEVKNMHDFRKIEMEIRQKFTTLIHEIRSIPIYETFKKNFFPQFLLQGE